MSNLLVTVSLTAPDCFGLPPYFRSKRMPPRSTADSHAPEALKVAHAERIQKVEGAIAAAKKAARMFGGFDFLGGVNSTNDIPSVRRAIGRMAFLRAELQRLDSEVEALIRLMDEEPPAAPQPARYAHSQFAPAVEYESILEAARTLAASLHPLGTFTAGCLCRVALESFQRTKGDVPPPERVRFRELLGAGHAFIHNSPEFEKVDVDRLLADIDNLLAELEVA